MSRCGIGTYRWCAYYTHNHNLLHESMIILSCTMHAICEHVWDRIINAIFFAPLSADPKLPCVTRVHVTQCKSDYLLIVARLPNRTVTEVYGLTRRWPTRVTSYQVPTIHYGMCKYRRNSAQIGGGTGQRSNPDFLKMF